MELCSVRILIVDLVQALVSLVQAHVDMVQALVALVQTHVDLVQALVALVQAHPPQGGLIWVVRTQVWVGPGSGLVGAVCWVFKSTQIKQACRSKISLRQV